MIIKKKKKKKTRKEFQQFGLQNTEIYVAGYILAHAHHWRGTTVNTNRKLKSKDGTTSIKY